MSSLKDAQAAAAGKRRDLLVALDRIDDKVNVPKKVRKAYAKAQDNYVQNPFPWIIGAAGALVVTVGVVVWLIVRDD